MIRQHALDARVRRVLQLFTLVVALGQSVPALGFYSWVGRAAAT